MLTTQAEQVSHASAEAEVPGNRLGVAATQRVEAHERRTSQFAVASTPALQALSPEVPIPRCLSRLQSRLFEEIAAPSDVRVTRLEQRPHPGDAQRYSWFVQRRKRALDDVQRSAT